MPACLPSVYLFVGALFLFWPGSGNLAGAVEGGRSAGTGERDDKRSVGGGGRTGAFGATMIMVPPRDYLPVRPISRALRPLQYRSFPIRQVVKIRGDFGILSSSAVLFSFFI
jgi:hypothetical protein